MDNVWLRLFTAGILYAMIPIVLAVLTRKAMVFPAWGLGLLSLTLLSIIAMAVLAGIVYPPHGWVLAALVVLVCAVGSREGWFVGFRRAFDLQISSLQRSILDRQDLSRADLRRADLRFANLSRAQLQGVDLSGADAREVDFTGADLRGANLHGADLSGARLSGADLRGATLFRARLDGAAVLMDHRLFDGAILRETSITNAHFPREWERTRFLGMIEQWGAIVCGLNEGGIRIYAGRCILYSQRDGHFYQLVDEVTSWTQARMLAINARLRGPFYGYTDQQSQPVVRLRAKDCQQGYLWTVTSAVEEALVIGGFGRDETGGLWIGARGERGAWRWDGAWGWRDLLVRWA